MVRSKTACNNVSTDDSQRLLLIGTFLIKSLVDVIRRNIIQTFALIPISSMSWYRRDGVVVKASASQSVELRFISQVESYQRTLKNGIHSFPA